MRITGGYLRGRQIDLPVNYKARPTTDFAKEGLFNILSNHYDFGKISVLDLFSGTGCISYEFLSRGCRDITAIEMNQTNALFIRETFKVLQSILSKGQLSGPADKHLNSNKGSINNIQIVRHNVFDFLKICTKTYDIVFADPPYNLTGFEDVAGKILSARVFKDMGSMLVFEHPSSFSFKTHPSFMQERKYGNVHFSFFSAKNLYLQHEDNEEAGMAEDKA